MDSELKETFQCGVQLIRKRERYSWELCAEAGFGATPQCSTGDPPTRHPGLCVAANVVLVILRVFCCWRHRLESWEFLPSTAEVEVIQRPLA
ncbi:Hypothetical predicted protein [Marmota monax]|uniref:Uncharacterized protein n=1 Tax=Marmota monax TaxID=9995 RepID=A0A5E4AR21_MARMO|nr:hypothetical protein GHT09_017716 [Marmota monax]VTJ59943.1 Hypothetical predicted protein [Marmota monax]